MNLTVRDLSKTYRNGVEALKEVNLTIPPGMFGLLGPNGAGKSTLMRILATLQDPDCGSVALGDLDLLASPNAVRQLLGYLPQTFDFYPQARAASLLEHFAALRGVSQRGERKSLAEALLGRVNLLDSRQMRLGEFSGGMKQRFGIAVTLLGNPKLLIVDEPTAGLDPAERNRFHNLLSEIGEEVVVILSTHIVEDVSDLCTSMAVIDRGQILFVGEPTEAREQMEGKVWQKTVPKTELSQYEKRFKVISTRLFAGQTIVHVYDHECPDATFEPVPPSLENFYFRTLIGAMDQHVS